MAVDPAFGIDDYNRAKYYNETETKARQILMILLGKPGFYPSIPSLGMYVQQYLYQFYDEIDETVLKATLITQCSEFSIDITNGNFEVTKGDYNGEPLLLFIIPTQIQYVNKSIIIGISKNSEGQLLYNYQVSDKINS